MDGAEMAGNNDSFELQMYGLTIQAQLDSMNAKLSSLMMKVDAMEANSSNRHPSLLAQVLNLSSLKMSYTQRNDTRGGIQ